MENSIIKIKYFDLDDYTEEDLDISIDIIKNNKLINEDRINKMLSFTHAKSKKQEVFSNILLINNLKNEVKNIYYNKKDKPLLDNTYFNISHSGNIAVFITSDKTIGIDIEEISEKNIDILDYAFNDEEVKYIKENFSENISEGIIKLWTMKEAIFKASGMEVDLGPKDIVLNMRDLNEVMFFNKKYNIITKKFLNYYITIASETKYEDFIMEKEKIWEA